MACENISVDRFKLMFSIRKNFAMKNLRSPKDCVSKRKPNRSRVSVAKFIKSRAIDSRMIRLKGALRAAHHSEDNRFETEDNS